MNDIVKNINVGVDLSGDEADPMLRAKANAVTESWALRKQQRGWLFWFVLAFIAVMTLGFLVFAGAITYVLVKEIKFDWHYLLIGSSLILPPTVLLFLIVSRVYHDGHADDGKKEPSANTPGEQVISTCSELMKSVSELASTLTKKGD